MDPVNPGNNHLSAGDTPLPLVYGISSVAYLLVAFYWFSLLVFRKDTRVFRAHWLMYVRWFACHDVYIVIAIIRLVLVVCIHIDKALHSVRYEDGLCTWDSLCHLGKVLLQKERRAHWRLENWILHLCKVNQDYLLQVVLLIHLSASKEFSVSWSSVSATTEFTKVTVLRIYAVLLASGWMFIKPFLSTKDKRVISIVVPLQVLANIASAIGNEAAVGSTDRSFWVRSQGRMLWKCWCMFIILEYGATTYWSSRMWSYLMDNIADSKAFG